MPIFNISVVNQHFSSSNEQELPTFEDARARAIKSALRIGIEEVSEAEPLFGAEVVVGNESERLARFIVSIAVSPIQ